MKIGSGFQPLDPTSCEKKYFQCQEIQRNYNTVNYDNATGSDIPNHPREDGEDDVDIPEGVVRDVVKH